MEKEHEQENRMINTKIIIENTLRSNGINLDSQENYEKLENLTLLDYINMATDKIVKHFYF